MMFPPGPPASPSPATAFGTAPASTTPSVPPGYTVQNSKPPSFQDFVKNLGIGSSLGLGQLGTNGPAGGPTYGVQRPGKLEVAPGLSSEQQARDLYQGKNGLWDRFNTREEEYQAAIREANKGVKGKAYENYEKALKEEALNFGLDKEDAKNIAIFKAGLAMMGGTSRYAAENIGKGALTGLEDYETAVKEIKKAQRENRKELSLVEQARRAESIGDRDKAIELAAKSKEARNNLDMHTVNSISAAMNIDKSLANEALKTSYMAGIGFDQALMQARAQRDSAMIHAGATRDTGIMSLYGHMLAQDQLDQKRKMQMAQLPLQARKQAANEINAELKNNPALFSQIGNNQKAIEKMINERADEIMQGPLFSMVSNFHRVQAGQGMN
jgi:hypothetical protein